MVFKGRTVLAFIVMAMFASSILTLTIVSPSLVTGDSIKEEVTSKDLDKVKTAYELIRTRYLEDVDHDKIIDGAIHGMLSSLEDPFSTYMTTEEAKQFQENISSSFQGIGAEVSLNNGRVTIVSPIKGSPAEKSGLQAKDIILSVNGESLDGLTLNEAVAKIRGPKGTEAKLSILRLGASEPVEIAIVRDDIPLETVYAEMLANSIGKIEITQFSYETNKRFKEELTKLEDQGMKALIIDVRNDPGGLLDRVIDIVQPFIEKGKPIIQMEDREGNRQPTLSKNPNSAKPYPVAVLINQGSASASEILAGALKESAGSHLVGQTTYGKGTVQMTFEKEMGDGSNIKMTTLKWLTPEGNWINEVGIEPDLKVDQPEFFTVRPFSKQSTLTVDMTNEDVKTLQTMLQGLGYSPDRIDGYFSLQTAEAVKAFQRDNQLAANGEVDEQLMGLLESKVIEAIRDPIHDAQLKAAVQYLQDKLAQS
ncbi:S41 family peptidase [Paenibacillus sp. J2TS4]|uniref:S41 family peptidase n=1 Tax=Paenibacillus sp. J2TS4 TaxID=2807194 RepID=UPI001AFFB7E5|nr:S41 family peptidase [Paenibacillus sp. J2TS4]GIP35634.1 peptidase S41 [Paenibacillus sp. J2TS4]